MSCVRLMEVLINSKSMIDMIMMSPKLLKFSVPSNRISFSMFAKTIKNRCPPSQDNQQWMSKDEGEKTEKEDVTLIIVMTPPLCACNALPMGREKESTCSASADDGGGRRW